MKTRSIIGIVFVALTAVVLVNRLLERDMVNKDVAAKRADVKSIAAPARDGNIAIREEYDMAVSRNTVEAYELFIRRHPDHPLAGKMRQRLERHRRSGSKNN